MLVLRTVAFSIVLPGPLAIGVPLLIAWITGAGVGGSLVVSSAAVILAIGASVFAWCVFDFIVRGRGTPDPNQPPATLVVGGLYRLVRNPMYIGVVMLVLAQAVLYLSPVIAAYALVLLGVFHLRVVMYEEPTLARTFGPAWQQYAYRVPRWLPSLRRS